METIGIIGIICGSSLSATTFFVARESLVRDPDSATYSV